ncbi:MULTISPECIES: hypothetical protein [Micromonospora]|uniref:DUF2267 domain-containing protein n=1 Tax=Micromonospora chalcea TaxID=1874 RepID=A0ABX9Y410_MICCH|nr:MULTISPECIES: hypothetical protein [Micromonospora]MBC8990410.1 hypothetical protein [Micromonospora chalcea]MBP1781323.1 hypothetical protein [Micromonospora sp. HB375]MDH6472762.1 hypothetical protein [Micromonospora sp. H404/HB375]NHO79817.1 hypothetical protein [Micromonospora sp. CMU55-4]ODB80675.1 hypothetical protein A8711_19025 [Micromonospora sp. II]
MERLTADERLTLKTGAFGAVFLVSNAVPGVLAMVRESFAASGALAEVGGVVKEALTTGPLPQLPRDSALEVESVVLPALGRSMEILRAKSPADAETYRSVVLAAAERVAQAHRGIEPAEAAAIEKITQALAGSV